MAHRGGRLTLGEKINQYRTTRKYTKKFLSEMLGVTKDSILSWERNRFTPSGVNMIKIIDLLDLSKEECKYYFGTDIYGKA